MDFFLKTFQRPLRLSNSNTSVLVSINQSSSSLLTVQIHSSSSISSKDQQVISDQVIRMLRITEKHEDDLNRFQNLHPRAKEMGFGWIFRSPTLFEDAVKSILLCNTSWENTLLMAEKLCEVQAKMSQISKKRKRRDYEGGNFPNAAELSRMSVKLLMEKSLGYRAKYIIKFAKHVEKERIDLQMFEQAPCSRIANDFSKIKGFGTFTTANILMCLGFYHRVPIDTETKRHLNQVHGRELCSKKAKTKTIEKDVGEIYDKYAPFQCLAYWLELVEYYESEVGKLSELCPLDYHKISGTTIKKLHI